MRVILFHSDVEDFIVGIIPACAGNTIWDALAPVALEGSSPPVRVILLII